MKKVVFFLIAAVAFSAFLPAKAYSDGCYICASGSKWGCKYCRFSGSDTSQARKACAAKGCKISGTASCPSVANVKMCSINTGKTEPVAANLPAK